MNPQGGKFHFDKRGFINQEEGEGEGVEDRLIRVPYAVLFSRRIRLVIQGPGDKTKSGHYLANLRRGCESSVALVPARTRVLRHETMNFLSPGNCDTS